MLNDIKNLFISLWMLVNKTFDLLYRLIIGLYQFLKPLQNSIKGMVNPEEFCRIILTSTSAGGGFDVMFQYVQDHVQDFVTDPGMQIALKAFVVHCKNNQLPLALFVGIFILEYIRRRNHGVEC